MNWGLFISHPNCAQFWGMLNFCSWSKVIAWTHYHSSQHQAHFQPFNQIHTTLLKISLFWHREYVHLLNKLSLGKQKVLRSKRKIKALLFRNLKFGDMMAENSFMDYDGNRNTFKRQGMTTSILRHHASQVSGNLGLSADFPVEEGLVMWRARYAGHMMPHTQRNQFKMSKLHTQNDEGHSIHCWNIKFLQT